MVFKLKVALDLLKLDNVRIHSMERGALWTFGY